MSKIIKPVHITDKRRMTLLMDVTTRVYIDTAISLEKGEIGGVAHLESVSPGVFRIHTPQIIKQEVTSGSVDMDESFPAWMKENFPEEMDKPAAQKKINICGWHSHGTMGVFASSTDEDWIANYLTNGWFASIIGNRKGEWYSRVDTMYQGMHLTFMADLRTEYPGCAEATARAKADHKVHVSQAPVITPKNGWTQYANNFSSYYVGHGAEKYRVVDKTPRVHQSQGYFFGDDTEVPTRRTMIEQFGKSDSPLIYFSKTGVLTLYDGPRVLGSLSCETDVLEDVAAKMPNVGFKRLRDLVTSGKGIKRNGKTKNKARWVTVNMGA